MKLRHSRRWRIGAISASALLALAVCVVLVVTGVIQPNRIVAGAFPVHGVDVSSYQGTIDWDTLAGEGIDFAYIKATEGSHDQDSRFADNWAGAMETDLLVGAYHFFSFESAGASQARNIIRTVPKVDGALPVTVDVEFYGDFFKHPSSREHVRSLLDPLLAELERYYGVPPILYATQKAYDLYLKDAYPKNPIWIRSIATPAELSDGRDWTIWQYSNREHLRGYKGKEHFIDLNAFVGSIGELKRLARPADG